MPGRTSPFQTSVSGMSDGSDSYRYGFNGKENDFEPKNGQGTQQDYGMRIYDPRLGKFLSVDPITKEYPWYTPYQFAGNTPIQAIDLDGLEEFHYTLVQKTENKKHRTFILIDKIVYEKMNYSTGKMETIKGETFILHEHSGAEYEYKTYSEMQHHDEHIFNFPSNWLRYLVDNWNEDPQSRAESSIKKQDFSKKNALKNLAKKNLPNDITPKKDPNDKYNVKGDNEVPIPAKKIKLDFSKINPEEYVKLPNDNDNDNTDKTDNTKVFKQEPHVEKK